MVSKTISKTDSAGAKKAKKRQTGRPYIRLDDEVLDEKLVKMRRQHDVQNSRLIILADRISKHEHEKRCREHDVKTEEDVSDEN